MVAGKNFALVECPEKIRAARLSGLSSEPKVSGGKGGGGVSNCCCLYFSPMLSLTLITTTPSSFLFIFPETLVELQSRCNRDSAQPVFPRYTRAGMSKDREWRS